MEPGIRKYLIRILNTLSWGLLWLLVNCTAGIMFELAFIEERVRLANVIFYLFLVLSLVAYLRYLIRKWSEPIDFEE